MSTERSDIESTVVKRFFAHNLLLFCIICLITHQANWYLATAEVDAKNVWCIWSGCQINPRLIGNLCPQIAVQRRQALIPHGISYRVAIFAAIFCGTNATFKNSNISEWQNTKLEPISTLWMWQNFKNICRNRGFQRADIWRLPLWKSTPESNNWFCE